MYKQNRIHVLLERVQRIIVDTI